MDDERERSEIEAREWRRRFEEGAGGNTLPEKVTRKIAEIIGSVSGQTGKLDALRAATERTIGLLKERRAGADRSGGDWRIFMQGHLSFAAFVAEARKCSKLGPRLPAFKSAFNVTALEVLMQCENEGHTADGAALFPLAAQGA